MPTNRFMGYAMANRAEVADSSTSFLTIAQAAPRLGLTPAGVRSRVRRGLVRTQRANDGRLLIEVPADAEFRHEPIHDDDDELQAEIDHLRRELEAARLGMVKAEGERDTAVATAAARVEAAERIIADLTQQRDRLADQLQAMVADARRPFWKKWMAL
jgi:hypothetical protein